MDTSSYLSIKHVVKSYNGVSNAVDDISLDIRKGEFMTFLGPSGSGKTTTLVMIAGFEHPTSGEIRLNGHDLTKLRPWERNIGMVFQNYALFPHMTVAKNVEFPLRMRGYAKADSARRVDEVLELVGLSAFRDRHPRELSGGQQQRVGLARGLVFNPDVLLLDEPLGALDKNLREHMQTEIKQIHREVGITMIYVTHDQTEAMTMSDRVAVFNQGKIEQVAPPLEIYHRPATRFVGEFLGDSNFFRGKVQDRGAGTMQLDGLGQIRVESDRLDSSSGTYNVMIRPERLRVLNGDAGPDMNTFDMVVRSIVNYGDSLVAAGTINEAPMRVRVSGDPPASLVEGATIRVGWLPRETHVIAA